MYKKLDDWHRLKYIFTCELEFLVNNPPLFKKLLFKIRDANTENPLLILEGSFRVTVNTSGQVRLDYSAR